MGGLDVWCGFVGAITKPVGWTFVDCVDALTYGVLRYGVLRMGY